MWLSSACAALQTWGTVHLQPVLESCKAAFYPYGDMQRRFLLWCCLVDFGRSTSAASVGAPQCPVSGFGGDNEVQGRSFHYSCPVSGLVCKPIGRLSCQGHLASPRGVHGEPQAQVPSAWLDALSIRGHLCRHASPESALHPDVLTSNLGRCICLCTLSAF